MELDSQSSTPSSPSLSDIDEFYSAPSSPLMPGLEALDSLSQLPVRPRTNTTMSNSSSSSPSMPHATLPLIEDEEVWKHPHQIDLDNSPFSKMENAIINNLQMSIIFHVDEAFPFNTSHIWAPFCQSKRIVLNNPSVGNLIFYDTELKSSLPVPPPESKSVEHALFTGTKTAVLDDIDVVYTAKNSSESIPYFEYEQIKIVAPFYKSKNIVLNKPTIQLITVIKDGGKRHRCPPENISSPEIIFAPFNKAKHLQIAEALFLYTRETEGLFSCPCLLSSIGCSSFTSAHGVSLKSIVFWKSIAKKPKEPKKHTSTPWLLQHSLTGVELDSIRRWPYPRCYGETRNCLRKKIISWLVDDNRKQDALWLHGDAGNGKSAVAQTVGEYADQQGILGAAAFISRSKKLNDSTRIIPSISLQLALHNEAYDKVVTKVIQDNPNILNINANKRMQFKELVLEPFSLLQKQSANRKKTLIVLDGLDEIDDKVAQTDLIGLIAETLRPSNASPFIWLLCSRPEPHLHDTFRRYETQILYQSIITSLAADDTHEDIERFFLEELHGLKEKYSICFASDTNHLGETAEFLSHVKSNPFLYASTLVRFIGGPNVTNPAHQLEAIVDLVERPPLLSHSGSKYTPIDTLYLHILQMIPPDDEMVVLRLLGALTVSTPIAARYLAAMFGIPKSTFYSSLSPLYPVLLVPDELQYEAEAIRFYHVSFLDFLTNADFSGRFFQDPVLSRTRLAEAQLRAIASPAALHSHAHTNGWYSRNPFIPATAAVVMSYHDILIHAAKTTWDVCSQISQPSHQWLRKTLLNFNFQCLQDVSEAIPTYSFMLFLWWLRESVEEIWELRDLVRTSPKSDVDRDFVRACEQSHRSRPRKSIALPFPWSRDDMDQVLKEPRYVLAGMGKKTVLILLTSETVMVFLARDINDL